METAMETVVYVLCGVVFAAFLFAAGRSLYWRIKSK